jgi:hypothetical protein
MALINFDTFIDRIQDELGGNVTDFSNDILTNKIPEVLPEFSRYSPFLVRETIATIDDSKELDIKDIPNLLWVSELEYKIDKTPRQFIKWDEHYRDVLSMDITTKPSDVDSSIDTNEAVDISETGIDVTPTAATAIPVGTVIRIDNELMYVTVTGTTLTVIRAYGGSVAATHTTATSIYIPEQAYLYCAKTHRIPAVATIVGAATADYLAGVVVINVDGLTSTGTIEADTTFTITGDSSNTHYRLLKDVVLSGGAGDFTFTPKLAEAISENDVVSCDNSTLPERLETLLIDLVAARAALSNPMKLMIQINTGGRRVPITMGEWAERKLALTLRKLEAEARRYQRPVSNQ